MTSVVGRDITRYNLDDLLSEVIKAVQDGYTTMESCGAIGRVYHARLIKQTTDDNWFTLEEAK